MKNFAEILRHCDLFHGIAPEELTTMLACLGTAEKHFAKGQTIFREGTPARQLGIVLSGRVQIIRIDYDGNRSILAGMEPAQIFGESFACAGLDSLPVDVVAAENTDVLLLDARQITRICGKTCAFHSQLIFNLLSVVARKNLLFREKLEITAGRTTREKLLLYLHGQAKACGSRTFTISFDRQELADYLGADRSGLSAEISHLRREGVLESRRSTFTLL